MEVSSTFTATGENRILEIGEDDNVLDVKRKLAVLFNIDTSIAPRINVSLSCSGTGSIASNFSSDSTLIRSTPISENHEMFFSIQSELPRFYKGHTSDVVSIAISPCGTWIFSGSRDRHVKVWHRESGGCVDSLRHEDTVDEVLPSPDFEYGSGVTNVTRLFTRSKYVSIRSWVLDSVWTLEHELPGCWSAMSVPQTGDRLFAGGASGKGIHIFSIGSWECLKVIDTPATFNINVSVCGDVIFSGQENSLWSEGAMQMIEHGEVVKASSSPSYESVLSPCGSRLFVLPYRGDPPLNNGTSSIPSLRIYNTENLECCGEIYCSYLPGTDDYGLSCLAVSPCGGTLYINDGGGVSVYDTASLQCIGRLTREPVSCITAWGPFVFFGVEDDVCVMYADCYDEIRYPSPSHRINPSSPAAKRKQRKALKKLRVATAAATAEQNNGAGPPDALEDSGSALRKPSTAFEHFGYEMNQRERKRRYKGEECCSIS